MIYKTDLPQLHTLKLGVEVGRYSSSFAVSNLPSLKTFECGINCYYDVPSFSMTSMDVE